jgi:hypothetical protein
LGEPSTADVEYAQRFVQHLTRASDRRAG